MPNPTEAKGLINDVRNFMPKSTYRAEATINSADVSVGAVMESLVSKFTKSKTSIEGNTLLLNQLDKSLDLGFLDRLTWDRALRDINARIVVTKNANSLTISAEIEQGWTRIAAYLLLGVLLLVGWAGLLGAYFKLSFFTNGQIRSAVQQVLDDTANELHRNAALDKLS